MKKQMSKRKDTSPKIHQNPKIRDTIQIKTVNLTEKQKQLIEVLRDKNTKLVFISVVDFENISATLDTWFCNAFILSIS
jgi:hypothetical protein